MSQSPLLLLLCSTLALLALLLMPVSCCCCCGCWCCCWCCRGCCSLLWMRMPMLVCSFWLLLLLSYIIIIIIFIVAIGVRFCWWCGSGLLAHAQSERYNNINILDSNGLHKLKKCIPIEMRLNGILHCILVILNERRGIRCETE